MADGGIPGANEVIKSFGCNRDVCISGKALLQFIGENYPDSFEKADEVIVNNNRIYKIISYNMS